MLWLGGDQSARRHSTVADTADWASSVARETTPLNSGGGGSPTALRSRYRINAQAKRYAKYALTFAVTLVLGNAIVAQQMKFASLRRVEDMVLDTTPVASFPGAADEILNLFGKPQEYDSRIFSGYLPLDNGGEAFYFLAESQSDTADKDPVLLWLNGGPGASSLSGCFSENGPLLVNDDGQSLRVNDYAWNKNAHLLCIESPVGVGFSYNNSGVYVSDDLSQADDLYNALQQFYVKYPQLRTNDFIIAGESYGGIYVPTTARAIVEGNAKGDLPVINLKKFVVGNGVNEYSALSMVLYAYYHGILSTEEYQEVRTNCPDLQEFKKSLALLDMVGDLESTCGVTLVTVLAKIFMMQINTYNVYGMCASSREENIKDLVKTLLTPQGGLPHPIGNPMSMCLNSSQTESFFNLPAVRSAIHAKSEIAHWSPDALTTTSAMMFGNLSEPLLEKLSQAKLLDYSATLKQEVTPIWTFLLAHNVSGVIYHGDADMVCDFIGGLWAVESLKLPRKADRAPWLVELDGTQQVGGFQEAFEGLTYVTVKGAGHLVPLWKPMEAKQMLDLFVLN